MRVRRRGTFLDIIVDGIETLGIGVWVSGNEMIAVGCGGKGGVAELRRRYDRILLRVKLRI